MGGHPVCLVGKTRYLILPLGVLYVYRRLFSQLCIYTKRAPIARETPSTYLAAK